MSTDDLAFRSAVDLAALVRRKDVSATDLVRLYLARIERHDPGLRAYITVCADDAVASARAVDDLLTRGVDPGPLAGVPFAVKDQFDTAGLRTTQGSRLFATRVPPTTATLVERLVAAGGVLLGKLNMTEFALGGTQEFPFGQPRNPWDPARDPGGSSSGAGIATAAALCGVAVGEDTGGSVRGPAAFCGVVGVRPTWGRVSRAGVFPLAWSMDAPGPLTRTVEDAALVLGVLAGPDLRDPTCSAEPVPDYRAALTGHVRGVRVGVITDLTTGVDTAAEVRRAVEEAASLLSRLGATVTPLSVPVVSLAGAVFMALADAEGAGRHLEWLRTRPAEYDRGTRRRLLAAGLLPTALTQRATLARALIRADLDAALGRVDVLLSPTAPAPAATIASLQAPIASGGDAARRFFTRRSYTTPASLAGLPAISVPCGFTAAGLPIGLHLTGRAFDEATILRVAHAYERATAWHRRRPPGV